MTTIDASRAATSVVQPGAARSQSVPLLQIYAVLLLLVPSNRVIDAIGAEGHAASFAALSLLAVWVAATLFGFHDPRSERQPVRSALTGLWLVSLVSYALMHRRELSGMEVRGGDRWLMQLAGMTGVIVIAATLKRTSEIRRVLRVIVWAGAVSGVIAGLQFWAHVDLSTYADFLPGFSLNFEAETISSRAALSRVAGTAVHPIELGVVAAMLLPLALYLALYDRDRPGWRRWAPLAGIGVAVPTSVSRSAVIAVVLAVGSFVVLLPAAQRVVALAAAPVVVGMVFLAVPGLISTLSSFFAAGTSDPSVATRVDDYPLVERMVVHTPWFGRGGGTFFPGDALEILDNQYLKTTIELGLVGVAALALYFLVPVISVRIVRRRSSDGDVRALAAALGGSALAAAVGTFTFDSLSFPMFTGVHALVLGLIGACWLLTQRPPVPQSTAASLTPAARTRVRW